ncbi:MAG: NHL repeat-containing protein, partial [Actinomycetes bacterium]
PEGYIAAQYSGEGHAHALDVQIGELVAEHEAKGTLRRGDSPYVPPVPQPTTLRYPGKVVALPGGTFLVSDTRNHRLVELAADLETVVRTIGSGTRGFDDGDAGTASFSEPQGLTLLPPEVASWVGYDVVVADSVNHALRGVRLADGSVRTVAGVGRQWMQGDPKPSASDPAVPLSTPWDVAWSPLIHEVVVAMAGIHQLWSFDPVEPSLTILAGTTNEGLVDGPAREAWFAQTSGLSATGDRVWLADAETSSLRSLVRREDGLVIETQVGTGLFDFGLRDGDAKQALLQHPLGVTALPDGSVAICDTYNDAVRRYDPSTQQVSTLATGLREPSGAVVDGDTLVVVESSAHRLTRIPLGAAAVPVEEFASRTQRPVTDIAPGEIELVVVFEPPAGQKLDDRYGPSTRLLVSSTPSALLRDGEGRTTELRRSIVVDQAVGDGVLHVAAAAASCDDDPGIEFPACHMHQQDWGVPVRITADGATRVVLVLSGDPAS